MAEKWSVYADWNPWHGCTKISPGCKFCYVYRQDAMYGSEIGSNLARKANIDYKIDQFFVPDKVKFEWKESDYRQEELFEP